MTFSSYSWFNRSSSDELDPTTLRSRPARHIACPQRLKYIHNINDGYIPYVEDSAHVPRSTSKINRLGLYNTADAWQKELMSLAQQVQCTLKPADEPTRTRSSRRNLSPLRQHPSYPSDEPYITKRLLNRPVVSTGSSSFSTKSDIITEKVTPEPSLNSEHQDHGIWLLPILCHILHIDTIPEAQEWLVHANPTEKRLAMELISRMMQDMQHHQNDLQSDSVISDPTFVASSTNNLYWPYKCWQRQQQPQTLPRIDSRCERATSPLRLVTPGRRLTANNFNSMDRPPTRSANHRLLSSVLLRAKASPQADTPKISPELVTTASSDRSSRRDYRITTSLSNFNDENGRSVSAFLRGKTPLV